MKTAVTPFMLLACMLLMFATYTLASTKQDVSKQDAPPAWEHLALSHEGATLGGGLSQQIIRLGSEGWELVCVTPVSKEGTTVRSIYYFKRPK